MWQRRRLRRRCLKNPSCGAITFVQRFGSALQLNVHFHVLVPDGGFDEHGLFVAADKIPALDHGLDIVSTVVRPLAATVLAASVMFEIDDPLWALALGLIVGAPTALVPHAAKSTTRFVSSTTTAGVANPFISVVEAVGAVLLIVLGVVVPIITAMLVIGSAVIVVRWWRRRSKHADVTPA